MIFHFILNPKSGRNAHQKKMEQEIVDACIKRQLSYHIYYTTKPRDSIDYVRRMIEEYPSERQRFIAVGGDGTINEVANSAPGNPNVEFGVIANGSGNDFVRNFTNKKLFSDIDSQIDGVAQSFDLIKLNEHYCVNMVNIGFDCAVVLEAERFRKVKFLSPSLSYIMGVIVGFFFRKLGTPLKLIFDDGNVIEEKLSLTAIGNGKFCGGGFQSCPLAILNDGILDITIIKKVSRPTFLQLIGCYKDGTFLVKKNSQKVFKYIRTNHFKMEFNEVMPVCIDGEIIHAQNLDFTVIPGGFNFVIPKGVELCYTGVEK